MPFDCPDFVEAITAALGVDAPDGTPEHDILRQQAERALAEITRLRQLDLSNQARVMAQRMMIANNWPGQPLRVLDGDRDEAPAWFCARTGVASDMVLVVYDAEPRGIIAREDHGKWSGLPPIDATTPASAFDDVELAAVLAGLRTIQLSGFPNPEIEAIATQGGAADYLDYDEIDELCARLNLGVKS
jgi:hypothetical protein